MPAYCSSNHFRRGVLRDTGTIWVIDMGDHSTLLRNVKTLVKHPHKLSIDELAQILNDLSDAYSNRCGRTVLILPVIDHEQNRDLISEFKSAVQGTHYKPREKV